MGQDIRAKHSEKIGSESEKISANKSGVRSVV